MKRGPSPRTAAGPSVASRWVLARFDTYGRACLIGGLLLMPIAFYHRQPGVMFSTPKLMVLWLAGLGAMAFCGLWSLQRGVWPPRFRVGWAASAFVVAAGIATVFSLSPRLSLVGLYHRYGGFIPVLVYVGVMFAVVGLHWERPERLRALLVAIVAASVVVAASVLLQEAGVDRTLWAGPVPGTLFDYPPGVVGHSNFAGAHLGIAVPCLWYLLLADRRRRWRSALGAVVGLDVLALWYTQSRGGMLAAVVGVAAMGLANRDRVGRWAKAGLATAALVVVAAAAVVMVHPGSDAPVERLAGVDALRTKTLGFRLSYWGAAARIFADHPVVGTGLDTFYAYYPSYRPASDGATFNARFGVDKPHNVILEHATDSGALGLASYLAVIGLAVTHGYRRCRRLSGHERLLLAAFLGLLAAYLAQALVSIDQPSLAVLGWVAVGGIAALAEPSLVAARSSSAHAALPLLAAGRTGRASRNVRRALWLSVLPAAVGATFVGLAPVRAEIAAQERRFDEAIRLDPANTDLRVQAGYAAELAGSASQDATQKRRLLGEARTRYLQALALKPRERSTLLRLAAVETAWASQLDPARFAEAERWWQQALALDPNNQLLRQDYARELPEAERRTVVRLEAEVQVRPEDASTRMDLANAYLAVQDEVKARGALNEALRLDPGSERARTLLDALPAPRAAP